MLKKITFLHDGDVKVVLNVLKGLNVIANLRDSVPTAQGKQGKSQDP